MKLGVDLDDVEVRDELDDAFPEEVSLEDVGQRGLRVGREAQGPLALDLAHVPGERGRRGRLPQAALPGEDDDLEIRMRALQPMHQRMVERRHVAVLLGREPLQPGLARMDDEGAHAGRLARRDHLAQRDLRLLFVHADPAFERHRQVHHRIHRRHARGHQLRFLHQAGAEASRLHAVGRATDIEVDLVIAELGANLRGLRQPHRFAAAQLQRHRMLACIEADQPFPVAADHRFGRHHLGIEQGVLRQPAMEHPAMPVGPLHHRGHGEDFPLEIQWIILSYQRTNAEQRCLRVHTNSLNVLAIDLRLHT